MFLNVQYVLMFPLLISRFSSIKSITYAKIKVRNSGRKVRNSGRKVRNSGLIGEKFRTRRCEPIGKSEKFRTKNEALNYFDSFVINFRLKAKSEG